VTVLQYRKRRCFLAQSLLAATPLRDARHGEHQYAAGRVQNGEGNKEFHSVFPEVFPFEIEQLPDLSGYLKLASTREWL
jgi:hypothetical protein